MLYLSRRRHSFLESELLCQIGLTDERGKWAVGITKSALSSYLGRSVSAVDERNLRERERNGTYLSTYLSMHFMLVSKYILTEQALVRSL